jgi:asparagine N-glycosylation enzyme membrane subunit Stt3
VAALEAWFVSGRIIDVILAIVVLEAVLLFVLRQITGRGLTLLEIAGLLLSGVFLILAVRAALTGAPWYMVSLLLLLSFAAHLWELSRRLAEKGVFRS